MFRIITAAILLMGTIATPATESTHTADPIAENIDAVLDQALSEHRIVGAVVLVSRDGYLVYCRAAGLANRDTGSPMQLDTLFRLASISKPFVSAAAMALIERGQLSLDDRADKWLPDFRPRLSSGAAPPITIRQLLTHTSGLGYRFTEPPGGPYGRAGASDGLDQPGLSMRENLRRITSVPLLDAPGMAWHYSFSIDVLGAIIERVTHKTLGNAVHELVTGPLGIRDTSFNVVDIKRLAAPYVNGQPEPTLMTDPQHVPFPPDAPPGTTAGLTFSPSRAFNSRSFPSGGGGMIGTAPDVMRLLEAIRQGGDKVLLPRSAAAMMSNQIGDLPGVIYGPGWEFGFGGALLVDPEAAHSPQGRGTWRWAGVYGGIWFVDPTKNLTVVSLTNTTPDTVRGRYANDLISAVYRH